MGTNREKLERLDMDDDTDTIMDTACESVCEVCNREIAKNLNPQNPACEGRWCNEAVELWLDKSEDEATE